MPVQTCQFDVFDILLPELTDVAGLEVKEPDQGDDSPEQCIAFFEGRPFARVDRANRVYGNVEWWTGATDRGEWTVLDAGHYAHRAAADDGAWAGFLRGLVAILSAHRDWMVTCEADCDQYDPAALSLAPESFAAILERYRSAGGWLISVRVSAP